MIFSPDSLILQEVFSSVQGEGPLVGMRQIFLRLFGCHLDCGYCDTPETKLVSHPRGFMPPAFGIEEPPGSGDQRPGRNPISIETVRDMLFELDARYGPHHSVAVTGGEPLLQAEALAHLLPVLRVRLPVYLETAGDLWRQFGQVAEAVDWVAMDIKVQSATGDVDLAARHKRFLALADPQRTFAKCVVSAQTTIEEILSAARLTAEAGVPMILQPVTSSHEGEVPFPPQMLAWQTAVAKVNPNVRIIPQVHKQIGQR